VLLHSLKFSLDEQTSEDVVKCKQYANKQNPKKYKQTKPRKTNNVSNVVKMFSANAAGCVTKTQSLIDNIKKLDAAIITMQETHFVKKGKLSEKLEQFEVFEAIRNKVKGGTLIAVHKALNPVLIEEYSNEFELLVVEVKMGNKEVRLMSGYGPQENLKKEDREPFFNKLEEEVQKAKLNDKAVLIQCDANSKLGPSVIKGDPHNQTDNGRMLNEIVKRNELVVVNSLDDKCIGKITRKRSTGKVKEESIIDFVIASEDMEELIENMVVDEERNFVLSRYTKTKTGVKVKESDHNSIVTTIKTSWDKNKVSKRKESFNYKNKESLEQFKVMTSEGQFLSEVFSNEEKDIEVKTKQFVKRLKYCISKCFKKIRIRGPKTNEKLEKLFDKRRVLKNKKDEESVKELENVEEMIAEQCAEDNLKIVKEACDGITCEDGGVNINKMWKMKKKLKGRYCEPPSAMLDEHGNVVTDNTGIENILIKRYEERLKGLPMKAELKMHQMQRENLCDQRLEEAQANKTPEWTITELEVVLNQLKNDKSKDPLDLPNELFKPENIGSDLKVALLKLMNQIKCQQKVPEIMKSCNISSIYKNKGSKKDFENYRGVFRVVTLRSIMDKLIYNDQYSEIDSNLSDTNVGARKNRNIRDNIFVVNAITNEIVRKRKEGIDIQIFDVYKCFDKLWAKECFNDIYENGFTNDKLPLLYNENVNAKVAVKTSNGTTRRTVISDVIMQGTVWGSLMCTSTMDKLGKLAYNMPQNLYKYKGVPIPPLGMVDDVISVSCGQNTLEMNKVINKFIEEKRLRLSETKCVRIHIGKGHSECPELKVHEHNMKDAQSEKYLGDTIDEKGKIKATIENRKKKSQGLRSEIMAIVNEIPFGKHRIEVALKLRESMFLNGMLFNSEAWHGVTKADVTTLEKVDQSLLRSILGAHKGTPKDLLYLETGTIPIRWILLQRRINFLKHILSRDKDELIRKVYEAQESNPVLGDFAQLVEKDLEKVGLSHEDVAQESFTKMALKKELSESVRNAAFIEMTQSLQRSTKGKSMKYNKLQMQDYLGSELFNNEEQSLCFAIRTRCVKGIKTNFPNMHKVCRHCPLNCDSEEPQEDSQAHLLECSALGENSPIESDFMYAGTVEQNLLTKEFLKRIKVREGLLLEGLDSNCGCHLPGGIPDQSDLRGAAVHFV